MFQQLSQNKSSHSSAIEREAGAVMAFLAIVLVCLVTFVGFGIEFHRLMTALEEKQTSADFAALAALDGYYRPQTVFSIVGEPTLQQRADAAKVRAEEVTRQSISTALYRKSQLGANETLGVGREGTSGAGSVLLGRWWTASNEWGGTLPTSCNGTLPCFEPCPNGNCGGFYPCATSASVLLRTTERTRLSFSFFRSIGIVTTDLAAGGISAAQGPTAISSVVPNHIVIVFDLGRSSKLDSSAFRERTGLGSDTETTPLQPVNQILDSVYEVGASFNSSAFPRDRIAWIGYDESVSRGGLRNSGLVERDSSTLLAFLTATDPANASGRAAANLLPLPLGTTNGGSDLNTALLQALALLKAHPDFAYVENKIVILTNGMANCGPSVGGSTLCGMYRVDDVETSYRAYTNHAEALNAIHNTIATTLAGERIQVSTMVFGKDASAHNVLRRGTGTRCLTEREIRSTGTEGIIRFSDREAVRARFLQLADANISTPARYPLPAESLYVATARAQGLWLAVLPPCNIPLMNSCTTGNGEVITTPPLGLSAGFMDSAGRLYCNPEALSERDLVRNFVRRETFAPSIRLVHR